MIANALGLIESSESETNVVGTPGITDQQMCPVWKPPKTQHTTNLNIPAESCHDGSSAPPGTHTHLQHAPQGPDPSLPAETRTHAPLPLDPPHASYTHKYMYKCDPGAQNQSYVAQVYLLQ